MGDVVPELNMRLAILSLLIAPILFCQSISITQGPVVDAVTYSSARITWLTDQPSDSVIRFGRTTPDNQTVDATRTTHHSWYLSGLAPATTYRYQVCSQTKGGEMTCSGENTLTTAAREGDIPQLPKPPELYVDTSMPGGAYGPPFIIDEECSNLENVLSQIAGLEGDQNYEILIQPRTSCLGMWTFPNRPKHSGWIIVKSTGAIPREGVRVTAQDTSEMPRLVSNALPGVRLSPVSFPTKCVPGSYIWAYGVPGMALFSCIDQGNSGGAKAISDFVKEQSVTLTVPGHGYRSGNIVRVAGTGAVDGGWRITVLDNDRFSLDGAKPARAYQQGGTVTRNDSWGLVPHRSGAELPAECATNDWFLDTAVSPADGLYWCTSSNAWTRVKPGSYVNSGQVAAIQFSAGASRYRFIGIEVTHIPVPDPPPAEWSRPDYKQGNFGSLVVVTMSNDRIIFDRCDIHGRDYPGRVGRGLYLDGSNIAVINSRVHKINRWTEATATNTEAAAIDIAGGPGPGTIENNLLEAIGITLFFPDVSKHRQPPADYVIRRNHFSHPDTYLPGSYKNWSGKNYNNRQIVELKAGRRMVFEGNVFDGNWADITQGAMILLTPRFTGTVPPKKIVSVEDGVLRVADAAAAEPYTTGLLLSLKDTGSLDGIWEVTEVINPTTYRLKMPGGSAYSGTAVAVTSHMQISDIDIRNNVFANGPNLLWMNGHDLTPTTKTTQRIRFHNNLAVGIDCRPASAGGRVSPIGANKQGRAGIGVFVAFGMEDLTITNNTIYDLKGNAPTFLFFDSTRNGAHAGLMFKNNILTGDNATVVSISGAFPGSEALDKQWTAHPDPSWTFQNNILCCKVRGRTTTENSWQDKLDDVGFMNPSAGYFQIQTDSSRMVSAPWTEPVGVNVHELEEAIGVSLNALLPSMRLGGTGGQRHQDRSPRRR